MEKFICLFLFAAGFISQTKAQKTIVPKQRDYIQINVYHAADSAGVVAITQYLQNALFPALQKGGLSKVGAFSAVDNDTAKDKRLYVIVPLKSLADLETVGAAVNRSLADSSSAPAYTKAAYNTPTFTRIETILLRAFEGAPQVQPSGLKGKAADRVYELRSYESATEALHQNKVRMFNSGEIHLFKRLGFNAVFYGQVIAGSHMPNLMYMTSFENKEARDAHWKTFGGDPEWKTMSAKPEYQHNVSHIDIAFLKPLSFSKL